MTPTPRIPTAPGFLTTLGLALCLTLGACASPPPGARSDAGMTPEAYPAVFDAAREVLTDYRFTLDRVDAARGVITTAPKRTTGLAGPWDREQSTLRQEAQDLLHQHERTARVSFEPADAPTSVTVEVVVERVRRPNWRIESDAIRRSTYARDPLSIREGQRPEFREPIDEDRALAARLMEAIRARAGLPAPEASVASDTDAPAS